MRRSTVLAVGFLLVLAGCNALPGGETETTPASTTHADETTGAETVVDDPAETDDDSTGAENDSAAGDATLPPGLSTDAVTDAAALGAAHEEALAGRSYTYDRDVRVVTANGSELGRWNQHTQVGAERLRFDHTQTGTGVSVAGVPIEDSRVYTNGSVTFSNASSDDEGYRRESGRGFAATTFSSEQLLADVLNASETSVTAVKRDGGDDAAGTDGTWYRVRAESDDRTFSYRAPDGTVAVNATNVTATALVASSGFVRNLTYEFDFVRGNVSGHRTMTVRYSALGETTVERPAWVDEASNATDETTRR